MKRVVVFTLFVCPFFVFANSAQDVVTEDIFPIVLEDFQSAQAEIKPPLQKTAIDDNRLGALESNAKDKKANQKESDIPVLTKLKETERASSPSYFRLVMSFFVIALTAAGLFFAGRWWKKQSGHNAETTRIKILSQFHLGPRKSLAIVRVAGESILIGITDQNISMIKSLALIDDEFEEPTKTNFAKALQDTKAPAPESARDEVEELALNQIRDKVSARLKDMRPIG